MESIHFNNFLIGFDISVMLCFKSYSYTFNPNLYIFRSALYNSDSTCISQVNPGLLGVINFLFLHNVTKFLFQLFWIYGRSNQHCPIHSYKICIKMNGPQLRNFVSIYPLLFTSDGMFLTNEYNLFQLPSYR